MKTVSATVEKVDQSVFDVWETMLAAMYAMPGVGLAAPQLGVMKRLAVIDCEIDARSPVLMANPELLQSSDEVREHEESSPNLPGVYARVSRPNRVLVRYLDHTGTVAEQWFEGLWSTSVQHQIDHLNGMIYTDRLSRTKRRMVMDKYMKLRRRR